MNRNAKRTKHVSKVDAATGGKSYVEQKIDRIAKVVSEADPASIAAMRRKPVLCD